MDCKEAFMGFLAVMLAFSTANALQCMSCRHGDYTGDASAWEADAKTKLEAMKNVNTQCAAGTDTTIPVDTCGSTGMTAGITLPDGEAWSCGKVEVELEHEGVTADLIYRGCMPRGEENTCKSKRDMDKEGKKSDVTPEMKMKMMKMANMAQMVMSGASDAEMNTMIKAQLAMKATMDAAGSTGSMDSSKMDGKIMDGMGSMDGGKMDSFMSDVEFKVCNCNSDSCNGSNGLAFSITSMLVILFAALVF